MDNLWGLAITPSAERGNIVKTVKNRFIGLSIVVVLAIALAAGIACAESADESEARGTLYLVDQDWNGQLVTTAVAQILLEQEMGHTVATKFAPADSAPLFIGLERGDFHFVCCNWPSYSAALSGGIRGCRRRQGGTHGNGRHIR